MPNNKPTPKKKYYTAAEANTTLPLVRVIVRDITELARDLKERYERLEHLTSPGRSSSGDAWAEEVVHMREDLIRDQERMQGYEEELRSLGIELKDYHVGLIDFPCWMNNREVYLCWKLGEAEVGYWHEIEAGFAGRQRLPAPLKDNKPGPQMIASGN